jgi:hypothetical protein
MKITNILIIALLLTMAPIIMAQDGDCDDYEREDYYEFNTRQYKDLDVSISYGLGELVIGPSDEKDKIEGTIIYDSRKITPKVTLENVSSSGVLKVKTEKNDDDDDCRKRFRDYDNEMEFYFPSNVKTDLFLDFGVGNAEIDLTDIAISKLNLNCGLSDVDIEINKRNNVVCKTVNIESGLGDLNIYGLGNLAAKNIDINVGLGSAEIDMTGDKIYDVDVNVDVGLGSLDMILPDNANIEIYVDASFLSSVDIYGLKQKKNKYWVTSDWDSDNPTISMDVNVGMGSVDIVVED